MALFFQTLRAVIGATAADFLYTPIWWYTRGLLKQLKGVAEILGTRQEALAIDVWVKNIGKPMYFDKYYKRPITKRLLREVTTEIMKEIARLSSQKYEFD